MKKTQTAFTAATEAAQALPMKVDVKIGSIRPEGAVRAIASVNLNDCFAIRNVKVMEGSKGLFAAMPSYKAGNGEYKDICFFSVLHVHDTDSHHTNPRHRAENLIKSKNYWREKS